MSPYRGQQNLLTQIPGVDDLVAANIVAEIGVDMSVFATDRLAAWAGVCPGSHESAGKRKRTATRKGNVHLKTILVMSAMSAVRTRGSYYKDKYYHLKARCGGVKAAMAIAHKISLPSSTYSPTTRRSRNSVPPISISGASIE
jgi:transposase